MKQELADLLVKIEESEDFLSRAEAFFAKRNHEWSLEFTMGYEKFLERKREQICFEQHVAEKMAWRIALEQDAEQPDI